MKRLMILTVLLLLATACSGPTPASAPTTQPSPESARVLRVMTHDSFDISEEVLAAFETEHNVEVEILESGDAGVALNQAILSKDNPLADVFYGVDNTLLGRALEAGIFTPYRSPLLDEIPANLELDAQHRALPVDYGDVCLNYDKTWFADHDLTPPTRLEDLTRPEYRGLTVVENPATSSPGLAFLLATVGHFGEDGYLDYWRALRENDVLVVEGWEEAYWSQFTQGSGGEGDRPLVVSYASSPPAAVYFSDEPLDEAPTAAVVGDESCFRQIEFVGILIPPDNPRRDLAEAWVDFMLSTRFQEDIPLHMFMFPANENAALPEVFVQFAVIPEHPAQVDYTAIESHRQQWVEDWAEVMLR